MLEKGIIPDEVLCISMFRKYYEVRDINEVKALHNDIMRRVLVARTIATRVPSLCT